MLEFSNNDDFGTIINSTGMPLNSPFLPPCCKDCILAFFQKGLTNEQIFHKENFSSIFFNLIATLFQEIIIYRYTVIGITFINCRGSAKIYLRPLRVDRVLGFFSSRPYWDPPPSPADECVPPNVLQPFFDEGDIV
jgi:hypothetical protein